MFEFGQFNEFSDSVTLANPTLAGLAKVIELGPFVGQFYQAMTAPQTSIRTKEFKVFSRSVTSRDGVIGTGTGTGWDIDDVTGLKMTATAVKGLTVGHVLQVADEVVVVKSVNRSAYTIDVWARGAGSTTPAVHADQVAFKVIGFAGDDADLKNVEGVSETSSAYSNFVQTVFEVIDWTKHGELVRQGMTTENATIILLREAEIRVARNLSRMAIWGVKQAASDGIRSMSAGLLSQLADTNGGNRNVFRYNAAGALTEAKVKAALKEVFDFGGNPDTLLVSPTVKGYINTFNMANPALQVSTDVNNRVAGSYIDAINYEGAVLKIKVDADMPNDKIAVIRSASCKKAWLEGDGLVQKDEPTLSSREMRKSLQGSVGFLVEDVGTDHSLIYGVTSGPAEREAKVYVTNLADLEVS